MVVDRIDKSNWVLLLPCLVIPDEETDVIFFFNLAVKFS